MDEETRAYLDAMMVQINNQFERILDSLSMVRADAHNTKGHVLYGLKENLMLSQRVSRIESANWGSSWPVPS
jgi:hypothetical protein